MEIITEIKELLGLSLMQTKDINFTLGALIAVVLSFLISSMLLKLIRKLVTRNLPIDDKNKFISIFQFIRYLVYIFVIMFALNISGVNIGVL